MDAIDVAAIVAIVLCLGAATLFAVIARRMVRALRELDALAESLRVEAVPLVSDLRATVRQAGDDSSQRKAGRRRLSTSRQRTDADETSAFRRTAARLRGP